MYHNLTLALLLSVLPAVSTAADSELRFGKVVPGKKGPTTVAELFKSTENLEIVRSPEKIVASLLHYVEPKDGHASRDDQYDETQSVAVAVAEEDYSKLKSALLRESTYAWDSSKFCSPRYNARIRFHRGDSVVAVDFCFSCRILRIVRDGRTISSEDFDDSVFLEIMRKFFPNDSVLRKAR